MKRILAFTILCVISQAASANNWLEYSPGGFHILQSAESGKIGATAAMKEGKLTVTLLDLSGRYCKKGADSKFEPVGAFRVNKEMVRFESACIGGWRILRPETEKGKEYFASEITTKPTVVTITFDQKLSFNSENFDAAKKAMIDAESAM